MAGPVYHRPDNAAPGAFPPYYDGRFFIYEWMRHFIMSVSLNPDGSYAFMESFLPDSEFSRPMDMLFAQDGTMYLLEYGSNWNARNEDARLSRISWAGE